MNQNYKKRMQYKPSRIRIKIYLLLEKMHIVKPIKIIIKKIRFFRQKIGCPSKYVSPEEMEMLKREEHFHSDYQDFFETIRKFSEVGISDNAIISGYVSTFIKGGNEFFQKLNELIPYVQWIVLSQSGKRITESEKNNIFFDVLSMPRVPFKGGYDINLNITLSDEMKQTISEKEYLQDAIYNIKSYHDDMGNGYPEALVYYMYLSTKLLAEILKPKILIVHNKLYPMHDVMMHVCEELGVKTLFFEFGALPGTFALEDVGQMGGSRVAIEYDKFKALSVGSEDLEKAKEVCRYLKESGLNRNQQPDNGAKQSLINRLNTNRPIILYAGQNDYDSGICPYKPYSKALHSPIFTNSNEAAIYLAKLAKKYDWNLIYKPHPLPVKHGRCLNEGLPDNVIWISDIDINDIIDMADVVVTILSQVGDVSLIRGKATVMLGYTQLKGKGCCYEAFDESLIEETLKKAVEQGFTPEQKKAFIRHVAQVLKYYLYDDLSDRSLRFGRSIEECADYLRGYIDVDVVERNEIWLFYCRNVYEFISVINIVKSTTVKCEKHLIIQDDIELERIVSIVNAERLFDKIVFYGFDQLVDKYLHIFVPTLEKEIMQLYYYLVDNIGVPMVHLYDSGLVEEYYQDINKKLCRDRGKHEKYRENTILPQLLDIRLYYTSYMIWRNVDIVLHKLQDQFQFPVECKPQDIIAEKFIFVESNLFSDKIISNELDLLDMLASIVGKGNIIVKLYDESSRCRFEMRGYNATIISDSIWYELARSGSMRGKCMLSLYPINVFQRSSGIKEIYLYHMFVGQYPILKSNSFQRFMKVYSTDREANSNVILQPCDVEEYQDIIKYLKRNGG